MSEDLIQPLHAPEQSPPHPKELTGTNEGFIRQNPVAVMSLLDQSFSLAGVTLATSEDERQRQIYERLLQLISYCGTTTVIKKVKAHLQRTSASVRDHFRSLVHIDLDLEGDKAHRVIIEAEGPVDPRLSPHSSAKLDLGIMGILGEPNLKITLRREYNDGTNDIKNFEFGPKGTYQFDHWRRDRQPMQREPIDPDELGKIPFPAVTEDGNVSHGKVVPNPHVFERFVNKIRDQRFDELAGSGILYSVEVYNQYDAVMFLPPVLFRKQNRDGQFVTTMLPQSALPIDAALHPSYMYSVKQAAQEKGIDITPVTSTYSHLLFFLPGTSENVILLRDVNGAEGPAMESMRTLIADRVGRALVDESEKIRQLHDLYQEFYKTQDSDVPRKGPGTEIATAIEAAFRGEDHWDDFTGNFYGLTRQITPENQKIVKQIYDILQDVCHSLDTRNVYSAAEKVKFGLHPYIEGHVKVVHQ